MIACRQRVRNFLEASREVTGLCRELADFRCDPPEAGARGITRQICLRVRWLQEGRLTMCPTHGNLVLDVPRVDSHDDWDSLFLSLQDNGPDKAPSGVQISWVGWYFPEIPSLLDVPG